MRHLTLTRDLISRAFPAPVVDEGWTISIRADAELDRLLDGELSRAPDRHRIWLFAYGSLMWKPEFSFEEALPAVLDGWHRRFCLWQRRYRGTRERPNLMLALDEGGSCAGMVYRLEGTDVRARLAPVWKREMIAYGYEARWVNTKTDLGTVKALAFVAWKEGPRYAGKLDDAEIAAVIAKACGHIGPGAEYLLETAAKCADLGIDDEHLFRIEALVARQLAGEQA